MGKKPLDEMMSLLDKLIKSKVPIQNTWVICKSVDWNNKTMVATSITDGLDYFDVLLGLGADYKKPVSGTKCLIGTIANKEAASFLIYAEQIEEYLIEDKKGFKWHLNNGNLTINGDNLGGLLKIDDVVTKLNNLENNFNQFVQQFNTHVHNSPQAPTGVIPTLPPLIPSTINLTPTTKKELENPKIKHGS